MFSNYQHCSATPGAEEWPASLKEYASRCFSACATPQDKDMVEIILKGKITATATANTLWSKDWSKEELPGVLCRGSTAGKSKVELERENKVELERENKALKESKRLLEMANESLASKNESLNVLVERLEERVKCPVCMEVPRCDKIFISASSYPSCPCSGLLRSSAAPWAT